MMDFSSAMRAHQINWLSKLLGKIAEVRGYDFHMLMPEELHRNFFPAFSDGYYLMPEEGAGKDRLKKFSGAQSLVSSWVACVNLYWPFRNEDGFELLRSFFETMTEIEISRIVEFECDYREGDPEYSSMALLNEPENIHAGTQTAPDIGIKFLTPDGRKGIILVISVFIEHDFGMCPGYIDTEPIVPKNLDKSRCLRPELIVESGFRECHLFSWGRKYWDWLAPDLDKGRFVTLDRCPMSNSCDRLFRLQALARALQGRYDIAIPCVMTDARNVDIRYAASPEGLGPFPGGWRELFPRLPFLWLTHNDWVAFVNRRDHEKRYRQWSNYVRERYQYA